MTKKQFIFLSQKDNVSFMGENKKYTILFTKEHILHVTQRTVEIIYDKLITEFYFKHITAWDKNNRQIA